MLSPRSLLVTLAAALLARSAAAAAPSQRPEACPSKSSAPEDAVAMAQTRLQLRRRGQAEAEAYFQVDHNSAKSRLLRAVYGAGSRSSSGAEVAQDMSAFFEMHASRPVHLINLMKKALEAQKEHINILESTDQNRLRRAAEKRRSFLREALAQATRAQRGELPPDPVCSEGVAEVQTSESDASASSAEASAAAVSKLATASNVTAWGSDSEDWSAYPASEERAQEKAGDLGHCGDRQCPFEYLLDVDYIYEADNYLEHYMEKKYGPLCKDCPTPIPKLEYHYPDFPAYPNPPPQLLGHAATPPPPARQPKPETPKHINNLAFTEKCFTHVDQRAYAVALQVMPFSSKVAKPGTGCVFGVTPGDEGTHCVHDLSFGSFGWCYTKQDKSEWGPCSEKCPVEGPAKLLNNRVDQLTSKLNLVLEKLRRQHCE